MQRRRLDLMRVMLANARDPLEAPGRLYAAALAAARSLLVTRSLQPKSEPEVFDLFQRHFIAGGWIDAGLIAVIEAGAKAAADANPATAFAGTVADVTTLVASVRVLYESLDASLRLKHEPAPVPQR